MDKSQAIGTLFTDEHHSIIFVDNILQTHLNVNQETVGSLLGTPIHHIFGFSPSQYQDFLEQYVKQDVKKEATIDLVGRGDVVLPSIVTGILNMDNQNQFMGVDYRIQPASSFTAPIHITKPNEPIVDEILRFYFKRQLETLYDTATEWGGKQWGIYLNRVINETSELNDWDVEMHTKQIQIGDDVQSVDIYLGLMSKAAVYMSKMIGSKLVQNRINDVNEKTNTSTFNYIDRDWFTSL